MASLLQYCALLIVSPVIVAVLLAKRRCRRGLLQRLGLENSRPVYLVHLVDRQPDRPNEPDRLDRPDRPVIWIHAVSLGEVVAVTPLVNELHRRHPAYRLMVSTVTETGREAVEQRLAGVADHCYAPLDFPWVVSRFIERLQPCLYLFVETELWPNLLWHLRRRGVPTALVNGRLSTRSFARQQWAPRAIVLPDDVADAQPLPDAVGPGRRPYHRAGSRGLASQADREYQVRPADTSRHGGWDDKGSS